MTLTDLSQLSLNQDEYEKLQTLLSFLHSRDGEKYDDLGHILKNIATIYSKEDYVDFLSEGFSISEDLFILGYLAVHGKCLEASEYDNDLFDHIADFVRERSHVKLDVKIPFDTAHLSGFLQNVKEALLGENYTMLLFACDDYYENQFFVFVLPKKLLPDTPIDSSLYEPIG